MFNFCTLTRAPKKKLIEINDWITSEGMTTKHTAGNCDVQGLTSIGQEHDGYPLEIADIADIAIGHSDL